MLSREHYMVMMVFDVDSDGAVAKIFNENGKPDWTVCPECQVDDFSHDSECSIAKEIGKALL